MSDSRRVALPNEEREARFRAAFSKKLAAALDSRSASDPEEMPFVLPQSYSLSDSIDSKQIASIASAKKRKTGLPIILFKSSSGPILLTTQGVFFTPAADTRGYYLWSELDFIAFPDLTSDDVTFRIERDKTVLDKSISVKSQMPLSFGLWILPTLFSYSSCQSAWNSSQYLSTIVLLFLFFFCISGFVWAVPVIALILAKIRRGIMRREFLSNTAYHNVIAAGPRQRINFGPTLYASNIVMCIMLALAIYRAQQAKYGPASTPLGG